MRKKKHEENTKTNNKREHTNSLEINESGDLWWERARRSRICEPHTFKYNRWAIEARPFNSALELSIRSTLKLIWDNLHNFLHVFISSSNIIIIIGRLSIFDCAAIRARFHSVYECRDCVAFFYAVRLFRKEQQRKKNKIHFLAVPKMRPFRLWDFLSFAGGARRWAAICVSGPFCFFVLSSIVLEIPSRRPRHQCFCSTIYLFYQLAAIFFTLLCFGFALRAYFSFVRLFLFAAHISVGGIYIFTNILSFSATSHHKIHAPRK